MYSFVGLLYNNLDESRKRSKTDENKNNMSPVGNHSGETS